MSFIDGDGLPSLDAENLPSIEPSESPAPPVVETPGSDSQTGSAETEPSFTGYMKSVYEKVPAEHRPIVGQYLKEADTGFQNYARQTQQQIRDYASLGSVEELQTARALYETLLSNPQAIYDYLVDPKGGGLTPKQAIDEMASAADDVSQPGDPQMQALKKELEDTKKLVAAQYSYTQQEMQKRQQEENTKQYFALLDQLDEQHKDKGKVDRSIIHRFVASGMDPDQAYELYFQHFKAEPVQQRRAPAPTVLSGGGVPRPGKPLNQMSHEEQNQYLMDSLAEIARNNQ